MSKNWKFGQQKRSGPKKGFFAIPFEKWFANQLKVIRSFAIHFAKMIRNYPKSDSHFAIRHRIYTHTYVYVYTYVCMYVFICMYAYRYVCILNSVLLSVTRSFHDADDLSHIFNQTRPGPSENVICSE